MKKTLILAALLLATVMAAQTVMVTETGSISGKITDIITELPIEGIHVTLSDVYYEYPWDDSIPEDTFPGDTIRNDSIFKVPTDEPGFWETETDAEGFYEFVELPEGTYSVFVDVFPDGYDPYDLWDTLDPGDTVIVDTLTFKYYPAVYPEFIELDEGEAITGIDLALIPWGSDTCAIAGTVNLVGYVVDPNNCWWGWVSVFSKSGQLIGGDFVDPTTWGGDSIPPALGYTPYFVNWLPPVESYVVAEAYAFSLPDSLGGPGRDSVEYDYYYPQYYDHVYTVEEATIIIPSIPILDGIDFDLEKGQSEGGPRLLTTASGSISGKIIGGNGNVAYTCVYAKKDGEIVTGRINKNGTYTLHVEPGTYEVYATRPGYKTSKHAGLVSVADKAVTGIDISMVYVVGVEEQKTETIKPALLIEANTIATGAVSRITYSLPSSGKVAVKVFDANGALVRTLEEGAKTAGLHSVSWDWCDARGNRLSTGVYFCRVEQNGECATRPLVLIR